MIMRVVTSGYSEGAYSVHINTVHSWDLHNKVTRWLLVPHQQVRRLRPEFCFPKCYRVNNVLPPKWCLHPKPGNPWICFLMWQKGLCWCVQMKDLEVGDYLGHPGGTNLTTRILISRRGWEDQIWRQGMIMEVQVSVMWAHELRRQGTDSPLCPPEGTQPCWHPGISPERLTLNFWPLGL